jgi:hypothetical protein
MSKKKKRRKVIVCNSFSVAFVDIYLAVLVVNLYELAELPLLLKQVFHHT